MGVTTIGSGVILAGVDLGVLTQAEADQALGLPGLGRVRMSAVNSTQTVDAWVDGPVLPTESGYGGWTVVPHEGAEGAVEYTGVEPKRWTLPILVDGWSASKSVQADWDAILALAEEQGDDPPPQVRFSGTVPPALSARPWLIEKPAPGSSMLINSDNVLLRASVVLNLLKPTTEKDIASPLKQAQAAGKASSSARTIIARPGDTLVSIAARELGNPERWRDISKLNNNLQPDNVKAGQKIKLPA